MEKIGFDQFNKALASGIEITIVGDNDFYSQRAQVKILFACVCALFPLYLTSPNSLQIARSQTSWKYC